MDHSSPAEMNPAENHQAPSLERIVAIWEHVLQVSPITADTDFFELGGDSLLAVALFHEIERLTGIDCPITTIYDAPTPGALVALLEAEAVQEFTPLVCLKEGDPDAAVFLVHGIGGTVIELAKLGSLIEDRGAIYALQAKGLDGKQSPLHSIDDMASYYLEAIRSVQPKGPYRLGGYSFGGLVALEIARRLKAESEEIALLLFIDSYAHPETWPKIARAALSARKATRRAKNLAIETWKTKGAYLVTKYRDLRTRADEVEPAGAPARPRRRWLRDLMAEIPPALQLVYAAGESALDTYTPRYYPGTITFLKAATAHPVFPSSPRLIWGPLAKTLEVHSTPGDHLTLLTQYVASSADNISACLARARVGASDAQPLPQAKRTSFAPATTVS